MYCSRCSRKMEEQKRSYHKKRKWVCPSCGRVRMQDIRPKIDKGRK